MSPVQDGVTKVTSSIRNLNLSCKHEVIVFHALTRTSQQTETMHNAMHVEKKTCTLWYFNICILMILGSGGKSHSVAKHHTEIAAILSLSSGGNFAYKMRILSTHVYVPRDFYHRNILCKGLVSFTPQQRWLKLPCFLTWQ